MSPVPLVILPTYNEAENIALILDAILKLPSTFDVLVIDDHSPDGTADIVRAHAHQKRLHLMVRPRKLGLGTAYVSGFHWALEHHYKVICQMDADFSHEPIDLERLLSAVSDCDLAIGSRYVEGGQTQGWPWIRRALSRYANIYARVILGTRIRDLTGGFKVYRETAARVIASENIRSEGYVFQIETTLAVLAKNKTVKEIPIIFRDRRRGKSKISRRVVWEALWRIPILRIQKSFKPN